MTGASNSCGDIPNLTDANQRLSKVCGREHFIRNRGEWWNSIFHSICLNPPHKEFHKETRINITLIQLKDSHK